MNNAYPYRKLINDYWFQTVENPQSFDECDQYLDGMGSCNYLEKTYKMQKGTITEQCFDVVTILPNGNIKLTRIGAGENREVLYKS